MRENVRNVSRGRAGRERWEFALDGRQMAAVAVGALVIVGSSFVLGMNTGKGIARRSSPPAASASLDAFDAAHENLPTPPEPKSWEYEKLGGNRAEPAQPAMAAAPASSPPQARVPPPARPLPRAESDGPGTAAPTPAGVGDERAAPAPTAPVAAQPPPPAAKPPPAQPAPAPAAPAASALDRALAAVGGSPSKAPAKAATPASSGAFVIQVGASPSRAEADRIAKRFASRGARVLAADVDGKRWYRVRLASTTYDSRTDAERALSRLSRETGVRGFVTAAQ